MLKNITLQGYLRNEGLLTKINKASRENLVNKSKLVNKQENGTFLRSRIADGLWPFIRIRLFPLPASTQLFPELEDLQSKELIRSLPQPIGNFTYSELGLIYYSSRYFHRKKSWSSPQDLAWSPSSSTGWW